LSLVEKPPAEGWGPSFLGLADRTIPGQKSGLAGAVDSLRLRTKGKSKHDRPCPPESFVSCLERREKLFLARFKAFEADFDRCDA
jgi:hypothetical protein